MTTWADASDPRKKHKSLLKKIEGGTVKKMTPTEKAKETRKRHLEARKAKDLESKELREKLKTGCLSILEDPRLTPGERLEALKILHDLEKGR